MAGEFTGRECTVEIDTTGTPTWVALPNQTDLEVPVTAEQVDASSKADSGWTTTLAGARSFSINTGGRVDIDDTAFVFLKDNMEAATQADIPVRITTPNTEVFIGDCQLIELTVTGNNGEACNYSANFVGKGAPTNMWETP